LLFLLVELLVISDIAVSHQRKVTNGCQRAFSRMTES
jgi:hypothetical protein